MSEAMNDEKFWDLVDTFIDLANQQCDEFEQGDVSAALLEAAARFNSFTIATTSVDKEQLQEDRDDVVHHLGRQYKDMLFENVDDYIANYKSYIGKQDDTPSED